MVPLGAAAEASPEDDFRARFEGGLGAPVEVTSIEVCFLFLLAVGVIGSVESSPSSPDASRDDGWRRSTVDDLAMSAVKC